MTLVTIYAKQVFDADQSRHDTNMVTEVTAC